jgi:hypothetical protein
MLEYIKSLDFTTFRPDGGDCTSYSRDTQLVSLFALSPMWQLRRHKETWALSCPSAVSLCESNLLTSQKLGLLGIMYFKIT